MTSKRVALVTGSGKRRVGWSVAEALAARGYDLVLHYNSAALEAAQAADNLRSQGIAVLDVQANLADEQAVRALFDQVMQKFGRIDVLVNCAAIWQRKPLEEVTAADLRRHFDINTLGTFLCCQLAGLAMVRQPEGGCIINVGDWATARPYRDYAAYFPSKGAIPTLTRCLAVELGSRNPAVRVNCLLPGPVMLPPEMSATERQQIIQATLVKRAGRPDHVVQAVLFLLDNDFVTGICLPIDGGRSIFAPDSLA